MIGVVSCRHNRPEIHQLFIAALEYLRESGIALKLFVATTHEEQYTQRWVKSNRFPNKPLGAKWNHALSLALADREIDKIMIMGDDDLISPSSVQMLMDSGHEYCGTKSVTFIDALNMCAGTFTYQLTCDKLVGCGRIISRNAIEHAARFVDVVTSRNIRFNGETISKGSQLVMNVHQAAYMSGHRLLEIKRDSERIQLWDHQLNRGLDHSSDMHLVMNNHLPVALELPDPILDIKGPGNIWSFSHMLEKGTVEVDYWQAIKWLPGPLRTKLVSMVPRIMVDEKITTESEKA